MTKELVRCPCCRGSKKVAKLGGIVGDCDHCDATGKVKPTPKVIVDQIVDDTVSIVDAVSRVHHSADIIESLSEIIVDESAEEIGKRKIYKRVSKG